MGRLDFGVLEFAGFQQPMIRACPLHSPQWLARIRRSYTTCVHATSHRDCIAAYLAEWHVVSTWGAIRHMLRIAGLWDVLCLPSWLLLCLALVISQASPDLRKAAETRCSALCCNVTCCSATCCSINVLRGGWHSATQPAAHCLAAGSLQGVACVLMAAAECGVCSG